MTCDIRRPSDTFKDIRRPIGTAARAAARHVALVESRRVVQMCERPNMRMAKYENAQVCECPKVKNVNNVKMSRMPKCQKCQKFKKYKNVKQYMCILVLNYDFMEYKTI